MDRVIDIYEILARPIGRLRKNTLNIVLFLILIFSLFKNFDFKLNRRMGVARVYMKRKKFAELCTAVLSRVICRG